MSKPIRIKVICESVTNYADKSQKVVITMATPYHQTDPDCMIIRTCTPLEMGIVMPSSKNLFEVGQEYYMDFVPVPVVAE